MKKSSAKKVTKKVTKKRAEKLEKLTQAVRAVKARAPEPKKGVQLSAAGIRRIVALAAIERVTADSVNLLREIAQDMIHELTFKCALVAENHRRKTIKRKDLVHVLQMGQRYKKHYLIASDQRFKTNKGKTEWVKDEEGNDKRKVSKLAKHESSVQSLYFAPETFKRVIRKSSSKLRVADQFSRALQLVVESYLIELCATARGILAMRGNVTLDVKSIEFVHINRCNSDLQ